MGGDARIRRLATGVIGTVLSLCLVVVPAAGAARPSIRVRPELNLRFQSRVGDYTTTCPDGRVVVRVRAPRSSAVAVDGAPPRTGAFRRRVDLSEGQAFTVAVRRGDRRPQRHFVRCLPSDFPEFNFRGFRRPLSELYGVAPSLFVPDASSSYVVIFNRDGTPVWWYRTAANATDLKAFTKGVLAWSHIAAPAAPEGFELHKPNGKQVGQLRTVGTYTDGHELQRLPSGDHLLLSYRLHRGVDLRPYGGPADATIFDTEIQQITPGGELVWRWNSSDHVDLAESERWWPRIIDEPVVLGSGEKVYDVTHGNAIEPDGKRLLLSLRHTDAVYAISRVSGRIQWKLGGTERPQSLRVRRDPHRRYPFGGQHDVRVLRDGTVTVHDNETDRKFAPRAVRYRIDRKAATATMVEQVKDPLVDISICCGSARRYPDGGWLLNWGAAHMTTEIDAQGRRTFKASYGDFFSYRAVPIPTDLISVRSLRRGMNAMAPR